ncbi:MAG: leucine-rich repeat protein, partial [Oscillospiraceae bacterium]|nr:leucine-rich repeat protein [Oscillospiraceae bacterium]
TETVNLGENVTTIEPYAFSGFHSATEFVIPETVTSLGEGVFMETSPDSIELRASITELPASTFEFCSAEAITLPDTLERLGEYSLAQCSSLETLTLPYSLMMIDPGALMGCSAELYSDSVAFTILDNAVYSSDLTTLIWYGGDWEETEFTVPGGVQTIAGYAVNCANLETLYLPDSLFYIGEGGIGYSLTREYGESSVRLNTALTVIGPDSTGVTGYAAANELCYFTGEPSLSDTELTLAGDETATLTLDGVPAACVSFSCFDEAIATVDENGVITAHTSGTTEVYASVGAAYFKCEVTVTGDGTPVDTFDTSKYLELGDDDYQPWLDTYIAANGPDIIFGTQDNPFSTAYKGQFYYEAIWMAQSGEDVNSSFGAVSMYDPDYGAQFGMIIHGLATELDCYTQTDDMVLYSGVGSFDSLVGCNTINEVRQHIGETVTDPCFFSTAINPAASAHFAGELGTTLVIYADKEAIDGGYIEYTVGRGAGGEYELLLKGGVKMEVLGVGVRELMIDDGSGEPAPTLQRYLKLHMYAE